VCLDGHTFAQLRQLPGGMYGQRKRMDGKRVVVQLDHQPSTILEVHQLCSRLKRETNYQRRITYISGSECFIAEYIGKFPEQLTPDGMSVYATGEYVRSKPEVCTKSRQLSKPLDPGRTM